MMSFLAPILRIAFLLALLVLVAACEDSETVARVGDEKISEEQVEQLVEHFEEEFQREGREFPEEGTSEHRALEKSVLGLLVFRSQLEQAAAKLGVHVDEEEVEERLSSSEEASEEGEAYFENAMRVQLLREKVAAELGGIGALDDWVTKARREIAVEYEEGWAP
jgi:hypothetical protein